MARWARCARRRAGRRCARRRKSTCRGTPVARAQTTKGPAAPVRVPHQCDLPVLAAAGLTEFRHKLVRQAPPHPWRNLLYAHAEWIRHFITNLCDCSIRGDDSKGLEGRQHQGQGCR